MHETATPGTVLARLAALVKLLRPRQWVKNIFVLAPLLFSGQFLNAQSVRHAILAALLFCAASSAAYVFNDLHDVRQDRQHPIKSRTRPLAAGNVSASAALVLLAALYALLAWNWLAHPQLAMVMAAYLLLNVAYTLVLKQLPVVDIFTIATGFVLRVYAGAVALEVPVSSWMSITTLCLALYLAAVKRRSELVQSGTAGREVLEKYSLALIDRFAEMSATGALVFYSMFVLSAKPALVITIPLVLFGLFRYWFLVETLEAGESPTDVLLADWMLLLVGCLWITACAWILATAQG